jgi:hypothetical protein
MAHITTSVSTTDEAYASGNTLTVTKWMINRQKTVTECRNKPIKGNLKSINISYNEKEA